MKIQKIIIKKNQNFYFKKRIFSNIINSKFILFLNINFLIFIGKFFMKKIQTFIISIIIMKTSIL
ncbi:hypothetical protein AC481_02075 [miscellaneous Crenarchaeota group archaeon SMTZ-80]|nr:MAG: hypothetical protein AC481_02075 [miscellaneous Crenarchaeota group archaeon SMTZ-80]